MNLVNFSSNAGNQFKVAILIKETSFYKNSLENYYVNELVLQGVALEDIMAMDLPYGSNNKVSAKQVKETVASILPVLDKLGVDYLMCADSAHYKVLAGAKKADANIDNVVPCAIKGFEHIKVLYTLNYSSLLYNPDQKGKIPASVRTLVSAMNGTHRRIQIEFKEERYPMGVQEIADELQYLHQFDELAVDIEAFSLKLGEAGIGTISFAEDIDRGCAFFVDYYPVQEENGYYAINKKNLAVRKLLKQFFIDYKGNLTAHNCSYDFKQLIWELFMDDPLDKVGMLDGLFTLTNNFDDTKLIAYCALNSTSKPSKALKDLAFEYAGDYAQDDIKDIRKIEPFTLLKYNLTDTCSTLWVKDKYLPVLARDEQEDFYYNHCLPIQRVLLQAELHGMPMDPDRIDEIQEKLEGQRDEQLAIIQDSIYVEDALNLIRKRVVNKRNLELKRKRVTTEDYADMEVNINSGNQLRVLLYEVMGLPEVKFTNKGFAKTDNKTLKILRNHATDDEQLELLEALLEYNGVKKICSDFLPNFQKGILKADGRRYLHGNFNIGGTVSGRLSSSDPNLQNLPSGSEYGKDIKYVFVPPEGCLLAYSDFNSLEDYISALLSKDSNKMKVYIEKYDGHCLRAFSYFAGEMPDVIAEHAKATSLVEKATIVNSIKKRYPHLRQDSKAPTFLLTYMGTWRGLMENCGFSEEVAKNIADMYHTLYKESDEYQERRIKEAAQLGYMTLAFGLRLRCPLLRRSPSGKSKYAVRGVSAEERTLGNAMGQSYGLLNNRAMIDFMERVWASPYKYEIMPIAPIHDASYYIIADRVEVVKFVNDNLIDAMQWQEDPAIAHDIVKIGAELDICYDSWASPMTIKNNATEEEIMQVWDDFREEWLNPQDKEASEEELDEAERREYSEDDDEEEE